jgi:hypothetical protein
VVLDQIEDYLQDNAEMNCVSMPQTAATTKGVVITFRRKLPPKYKRKWPEVREIALLQQAEGFGCLDGVPQPPPPACRCHHQLKST